MNNFGEFSPLCGCRKCSALNTPEMETTWIFDYFDVIVQNKYISLIHLSFLNDLFLNLAIDTVFHLSGIIQNGMEISSKSHV